MAEPRTGRLVLGRCCGCLRIKPTQGASNPWTGVFFVQTQVVQYRNSRGQPVDLSSSLGISHARIEDLLGRRGQVRNGRSNNGPRPGLNKDMEPRQ